MSKNRELAWHSDEKKSLLTGPYREFLKTDRDIPDSNKRDYRRWIRSRVKRGLLDFHLLIEAYPDTFREEDIEQIFGVDDWPLHVEDGIDRKFSEPPDNILVPKGEGLEQHEDGKTVISADDDKSTEFEGPGAIEQTLSAVLAFLYLGDQQFELSIEQGIKRAKRKEGRQVSADARIRVTDEGPIDSLHERIRSGERDVSYEDITTLLAEGEITKDEADELFNELYSE